MYNIVTSGTLDNNSAYSYMLFATDFASTSVVARDEDTNEVVGFIKGFRPPQRPHVAFVWQIGVAEAARGTGLSSKMLDHLADRLAPEGVTHIGATVTPSNAASVATFTALARRNGTEPDVTPNYFAESDFPPSLSHESEDYFLIPLRPGADQQ